MKKMCKTDIRKVLWYFIIAFPLLAFLVSNIVADSQGVIVVNFGVFMLENFDLTTSNVLIDMFNGIFGSSGFLPIFMDNNGLFLYFVYFIGVELIHIILDVLLFLPNILHNIFDKIGGTHEKDF